MFHWWADFFACGAHVEDEALLARVLNLHSHGQYSIYDPVGMLEQNKEPLRRIAAAFLERHVFELPQLTA